MQWIHVVSMKFLLQRQFYHIIENKSAGLKYLDGNLIPIFSPFDRFFYVEKYLFVLKMNVIDFFFHLS